jgi:hypothetical protein
MNFKAEALLKSIGMAFAWLLLNTIFGCIPFGIIKFLGIMQIDPKALSISEHELEKLVKECAVLFVFCVIMIAVMLDFFFSKLSLQKWHSGALTMFALLPMVLVGLVYGHIVFGSGAMKNFENLLVFQSVLIVYSVIYCMLSKTIFFYKEYTNE